MRVAIVVPRFGLSAVRRNRLKRRLRELVRLHVLPLAGSADLLLRARRASYDVPFETLRADVESVVAQL
jgi:ribonuclease P protein component